MRYGWLPCLLCAGPLLACDPPPESPMVPMGPPVPTEPGEAPGPMADPVPMVECAGNPDAGPKGAWRHGFKSPAVVLLGSPRHRGLDLVSGATAGVQHVRGEISYGPTDKALEDEQVDLFACKVGAWRPIGSAVTDGDGRFDLALSGGDRLALGVRPLYVSVTGDRSGARFLGVVLPAGAKLAVSDIDGTLTTSENAFPESLLTGAQVAAHDGAREALGALAGRRYTVLYLTARGTLFTEATREWLVRMGLPLGPIHLAPRLLTLPGDATVAYKVEAMDEATTTGLSIGVGIGNRASDAAAYLAKAVSPQAAFLKQPEFQDEIGPVIARGEAVGFDSYRALVPVLGALPLGR